MREIKFRGYCERDSEWRYGFYVTDGKTHEILTLLNCGSMYASQVDPESVGQYTGLKDKNGVEICEGDIIYVHGDSFVGKVLFDDTALCWCVEIYSDKAKIELMTLKRFIYSREKAVNGKLEVIGNIHENPELLE